MESLSNCENIKRVTSGILASSQHLIFILRVFGKALGWRKTTSSLPEKNLKKDAGEDIWNFKTIIQDFSR